MAGKSHQRTRCERNFQHADKHAEKHDQIIKQRQAQAKRKTRLRLLARQQVKQTKALTKVPCFAGLDNTALFKIVDNMTYRKYNQGESLCHQGDISDKLFILVRGLCGVYIKTQAEWKRREAWVRVGELKDMDICGESALAVSSSTRDHAEARSATITAESENVETLELARDAFFSLVSGGVIHTSVVTRVSSIRQSRSQSNKKRANLMKETGRVRSITKTRLAPVSSMSFIHNFGITRQQSRHQRNEWRSQWKQRLDTFSINDFRHGWRCLDAPEDRMMRSRYVNENFSWMKVDGKSNILMNDDSEANFKFD